VATVSLGSEIPVEILITKKWGLIVVKTARFMFTFTVNGILVRKVEHDAKIRMWMAFHTRDCFDFVLCWQADFKVVYFEAADPEKLCCLDPYKNLVGMSYNPAWDCFLFICADGKVVRIPRCIEDEDKGSQGSV
jgi:hypothetical protein